MKSSLAASLFFVAGFLILAGCAASEPAARASGEGEAAPAKDAAKELQVSDGYTRKSRDDVTSDATTLDAEKLHRERSATYLSDLLRGSVAGVRVSRGSNGGVQVRIRGISSINGSNAPLYVVDGVSTQATPGGALPWLNPNNVKSITVLRGPSAAIYGSRGANGVIVIETK